MSDQSSKSKSTTSGNLAVALEWARAGCRVFPCRPQTVEWNGNVFKAKTPLVPSWRADASTDETIITRAWQKHPDALPGLVDNRFITLDLDIRPGGDGRANLQAFLQKLNIDIGQPMRVATPSGGEHLYFQLPPGLDIGNKTGGLPDFIDVRSGGAGYVIAEGACLPDGRVYRRISGPNLRAGEPISTLPLLPAALVRILQEPKDQNAAKSQAPDGAAPSSPAGSSGHEKLSASSQGPNSTGQHGPLENIYNELFSVPPGARGSACNRLSFKAGTLVASGSLNPFEAARALFAACQGNGLVGTDGEAAVKRTIERGIMHGIAVASRPNGGLNAKPSETGAPPKPSWQSRIIREDIDILDTPRELVPGMIAERQAGVLTAMWGTGKSFVAIDWGVAIATGVPINGKMPELNGLVLYFCGEGQADIRRRIAGALQHRGLSGPIDFIPYDDVPDLTDAGEIGRISEEVKRIEAERGKKVVLIIIDTLSRAMKSGSDNEHSDLKPAVRNVVRLRDEQQLALLIVHHPPVMQQEGGNHYKRPRGPGFLEGDLDFSLFGDAIGDKENKDRRVKLSIRKQKELPDTASLEFSLKQVELGKHPRTGNPVTTCAVDYNPTPSSAQKAKTPEPMAGLQVAKATIRNKGNYTLVGPGLRARAADREVVKSAVASEAASQGKTAEAGFRRFSRLLQAGHLCTNGDLVWLEEDVQSDPLSAIDLTGTKFIRMCDRWYQ